MLLAAASLLLAQAGPPATLEQDRLTLCLDHARSDAASAIAYASTWLGEGVEAEASFPLQCLGIAYTRLLRWDAAEEAFVDAREAAPQGDPRRRARLGGMAGNAALEAGNLAEAVNYFSFATEDALAAGDSALAGDLLADQSRALVGLGDDAAAGRVLGDARRLNPQNPDIFLLSATLARREGNLERAAAHIGTAAALAPQSPAVALEAGVIAMLAGDEMTARRNWEVAARLAPDSPTQQAARAYLAQLEPAPAMEEDGR